MARSNNAVRETSEPYAPPAEPPVRGGLLAMPSINQPEGDFYPQFAISLEEEQLRNKQLFTFVREHMIEGVDYGTIKGCDGNVLFKPGAEKLCAIFGFATKIDVTSRTEDWTGGFLAYEVRVRLVDKRTGRVVGDGVASCNSREKRYRNQDPANVANTLLKMAKKRALIDAVLAATRSSGLFALDLEDLESEDQREQRSPRPQPAAIPAQTRSSQLAAAVPVRAPQPQPAPVQRVPAPQPSIDLETGEVYRAAQAPEPPRRAAAPVPANTFQPAAAASARRAETAPGRVAVSPTRISASEEFFAWCSENRYCTDQAGRVDQKTLFTVLRSQGFMARGIDNGNLSKAQEIVDRYYTRREVRA